MENISNKLNSIIKRLSMEANENNIFTNKFNAEGIKEIACQLNEVYSIINEKNNGKEIEKIEYEKEYFEAKYKETLKAVKNLKFIFFSYK